jgi:threonine/homoserine/homoserine lactone efflux protein
MKPAGPEGAGRVRAVVVGPAAGHLSFKTWIDRTAGLVMFGLGLRLVSSAAKP